MNDRMPLINGVRIEKFRAIREASVRLAPLTVLIGPNDSGKSSFLDALARKINGNLVRDDAWRGGPEVPMVTLESGTPGLGNSGVAQLFRLPSRGIEMRAQGATEAAGSVPPRLADNGENLAAYFDYLLRKDRRRFDTISQVLREYVQGLEEILIDTPSADSRSITVAIDGGFVLPGDRLSTGVRLLMFFVALAYHVKPPALVLIEEPENGVHPKRLKEIMGLLRSLTRGELGGHRAQVILSTHSPYLLDHVRLPEDQVLVFRRDQNGARTITAADEKSLHDFLGEFMLGELWFNQGEEGLIGIKG